MLLSIGGELEEKHLEETSKLRKQGMKIMISINIFKLIILWNKSNINRNIIENIVLNITFNIISIMENMILF